MRQGENQAVTAAPFFARELVHTVICDVIDLLPPRVTVPAYYRWRTRQWPKSPPVTFNERVHAAKLQPPTPEMVRLADKISVKEVVKEKLGADWVVPTLYQGDQLPPIEGRNWPQPYVIKASHGSSWNIFVRETPNWRSIEARVAGWLRRRPYRFRGESHYRLMQPRILVEPLLGATVSPPDYKVFVFGGRAAFVQVDVGRHSDHRRSFFDLDWKRLPFTCTYPPIAESVASPQSLQLILKAAETMSEGFSFLRVDFYDIDGHPYFGEATFFPGAGAELFDPPEYEKSIGDMWR